MGSLVNLLLLQMMLFFTPNPRPKSMLTNQSIKALMARWHPIVCSPTIEHCVPRSYYHKGDKVLGRDMHALICLPKALNFHRSNYKLVDADCTEGWRKVGPDPGIAFRHDRRRLFVPPEHYRGPYARSIGYFVLTYPSYFDIVHSNVLDLELLLKWSCLYPCTSVESKRHETIASIQQNYNPFFVDPKQAHHGLLTLLHDL